MERKRFNLEEWLQDKSRKVVTRDGRAVRIVCWDVKGLFPILALIEGDGKMDTKKGDEYPCSYEIDGTCPATESYDLFFADDKDELTEFEKELYSSYMCIDVVQKYYSKEDVEHWVKMDAPKLLDLARKQLQPDIDKEIGKAYRNQDNVVYNKGYEDALKSLRWKKFLKEYEELDSKAILLEDNGRVVLTEYLERGDYYLTLDDLKTLPNLTLDDLKTLPKEE